jgi:hypothetical protein
MSLKVWTIWNSYGSHGEDKVQGPDSWNTEVVEKAEYDKLMKLAQDLANTLYDSGWHHGRPIVGRFDEYWKEALDASE